ncbi:ABC transporter substrate-binding protein [Actinosynnema sp. NPDC059797]
MKQRTPWSAALVLVLALSAGCGSAAVSGPPAGGSDGGLVVWDWKSGDADAAAYLEKARADFARSHPDVDVEFVAQPYDQYYTLLGAAVQAGRGPDVVLFNGGGRIRDRVDSLLPLDEYVAEDRRRLAGWDAFTLDGKTYASPVTLQGHPLYYNKALYRQAGLDPEAPATTWDEFVEDCGVITDRTGASCLGVGNKEGIGIQFFLSAMGSAVLPPDEYDRWVAGQRNWTSPGVKRIFELWRQAEAAGLNNDGVNSTAMFNDAFAVFQSGRAAHVIGLMSDVGHWKDFGEFLEPADVGVMAPPLVDPAAKPSLPYDGGIGYAVARSARNPEVAADLVRSLTSTAALEAFAADAGAIASDTTVDASAGGPAVTAIIAGARTGKPALHVALPSATLDLMGRLSQQLLSGSTTVDEAVAQLAASDAAG